MTTLVQDINAALLTLAPAGGVWNAINTAEPGDAATVPYIVFLRVVSTTNNTLSGPSALQNTRVQVDVFDRTYSSAAALAQSVQTALLAAFPACVQISSFDVYEDAVKAYRISADFSIWSTN